VAKIVAWFQGLPLGLRAGLVGFILGAVVCAGIYGILAGSAIRALGERQAAVDANIAELVRQNQDSAERLESLRASIGGIESEVAAYGSAVQSLARTVGSIEESVGAIGDRIGRIEEGQRTVDAELEQLTRDFAALGGQISSLGASLDQIGSGLQGASSSLSGADADIGAATSILQGLQKLSPKPFYKEFSP